MLVVAPPGRQGRRLAGLPSSLCSAPPSAALRPARPEPGVRARRAPEAQLGFAEARLAAGGLLAAAGDGGGLGGEGDGRGGLRRRAARPLTQRRLLARPRLLGQREQLLDCLRTRRTCGQASGGRRCQESGVRCQEMSGDIRRCQEMSGDVRRCVRD